jgi:prolipoprotein diacylglyceryltransferase
VPLMMDALAPCILMAQGIGRIGNYFNQELFGKPTTLPWGPEIAAHNRPRPTPSTPPSSPPSSTN